MLLRFRTPALDLLKETLRLFLPQNTILLSIIKQIFLPVAMPHLNLSQLLRDDLCISFHGYNHIVSLKCFQDGAGEAVAYILRQIVDGLHMLHLHWKVITQVSLLDSANMLMDGNFQELVTDYPIVDMENHMHHIVLQVITPPLVFDENAIFWKFVLVLFCIIELFDMWSMTQR